MNSLPDGLALDPDTFGIVVNNKEEPKDEWVEKADTLSLPLTFTLNIPAEKKQRMERMAKDANMTVDSYIQQLIDTHMSTAVAKPMITGPSMLSGTASNKRITGPTYSVKREDTANA